MLVLTRKIGESIQIGDDVTVEVLEMRGGRIRLGISAPHHVSVNRSELVFETNPSVESASASRLQLSLPAR